LQRALAIYKPTQQCIEILRELVNSAKTHGVHVEVYTVDDASSFAEKARLLNEPVDIIFSIGGDGTFLRASRFSLLYDNTLVFPYPCGRRNVFYEFVQAPIGELVERVLNGDYFIELYPAFSVRAGTKSELFINEITVVNNNLGKVAKYSVKIKSPLLNTAFTLEGDGLLVSTSAGSSGYNLSARGPLASTFLDSIVITPLNPLQLGFPPLVLPRTSVVEITILNPSTVYIDGDYFGSFGKNIVISVIASSRYVKVIRFSPSKDLVRAVLASRTHI
jgi:NAD+ kinase